MGIVKLIAGGCRKPPGHGRATAMQKNSIDSKYIIIEVEAIPDGNYIDQILQESIKERCLCSTPCHVCTCSAEGGL